MLTIFQGNERGCSPSPPATRPRNHISVVPLPQRPRQRRGDAWEGRLPRFAAAGWASIKPTDYRWFTDRRKAAQSPNGDSAPTL